MGTTCAHTIQQMIEEEEIVTNKHARLAKRCSTTTLRAYEGKEEAYTILTDKGSRAGLVSAWNGSAKQLNETLIDTLIGF